MLGRPAARATLDANAVKPRLSFMLWSLLQTPVNPTVPGPFRTSEQRRRATRDIQAIASVLKSSNSRASLMADVGVDGDHGETADLPISRPERALDRVPVPDCLPLPWRAAGVWPAQLEP